MLKQEQHIRFNNEQLNETHLSFYSQWHAFPIGSIVPDSNDSANKNTWPDGAYT